MEDLAVHNRVVERLCQKLYNRKIIDNVDRGVYLEYMVEVALQAVDPAWECKPGWAMWDLKNKHSGTRLEVKQSAKRQTWSVGSRVSASAPRFSIKPTRGYYEEDIVTWVETELRRQADIYIFAYHPEADENVADHRRHDQWEFYVVPENMLPQGNPLQKSIGLNPVRRLRKSCNYDELAREVTRSAADLSQLKANLTLGSID